MGIWMFFNLDFGAGKSGLGIHRANILEAVDRFGSISAAAPAVNLTFSQMWRVVRILNSHCKKPMVATRRGGRDAGAFLTPLGRDVLARFREIERVINESAAPYIQELERVVGVDKTPPRIPRFAQIIDPSKIPTAKKSRPPRRKTTSGARKRFAKKKPTNKRPLKLSRPANRR